MALQEKKWLDIHKQIGLVLLQPSLFDCNSQCRLYDIQNNSKVRRHHSDPKRSSAGDTTAAFIGQFRPKGFGLERARLFRYQSSKLQNGRNQLVEVHLSWCKSFWGLFVEGQSQTGRSDKCHTDRYRSGTLYLGQNKTSRCKLAESTIAAPNCNTRGDQ